ncbi:MAG TPA: hypothetical protein PLY93_12270 [Turneriella sp.]|nr:hypothetical protein [Turneriella sp.]
MTKGVSQCLYCTHYQSIRHGEKIPRCKAFPDGIPMPLFFTEVSHRKPYPLDNGIQFEPIDELKESEE